MKVDVVVNERSDVWLVHDTPFIETVKWAEFDMDMKKLYLILLSGRQQELGFPVPKELERAMKKARQLFLILMHDSSVKDCASIPLMVRGHNN